MTLNDAIRFDLGEEEQLGDQRLGQALVCTPTPRIRETRYNQLRQARRMRRNKLPPSNPGEERNAERVHRGSEKKGYGVCVL